ncbi:unnamed protein product, partial [Rotaria sp. Silwood2]
SILKLGGMDGQQQFREFQDCINRMIEIGVDLNDNNKSRHYKQLFNNIICNDICFNKASKKGFEQNVGEPSLDLFVDKYMKDGDGLIVSVQHVKKFLTSDIIIGIFAIGMTSNSRWFVINTSEIENNQNKTKEELEYLLLATNHFRKRAKGLGAVENLESSKNKLTNYNDDQDESDADDDDDDNLMADVHALKTAAM